MRGIARGGEEGLDDLRRALQLALEQGLGRETAVIHGNLAGAFWVGQGPQAGLEATRDAIAFCERRGIADVGLQMRSSVPELLAELGQTEQALSEAGRVAEPLEATGDMARIHLRTLQLALLAERGSTERARDLYEFVEAAREIGLPGALLGEGRCLRALGDLGADRPLAKARDLFTSLGYAPALAETEALLAEQQPAA